MKILVTKYPNIARLYRELGFCDPDTPTVSHVRPADVNGKDCYGTVPLHLAAYANSVTEIPFVPERGMNFHAMVNDMESLWRCMQPAKLYHVKQMQIPFPDRGREPNFNR